MKIENSDHLDCIHPLESNSNSLQRELSQLEKVYHSPWRELCKGMAAAQKSPCDASSAPNHQSSVGLNRDSSIDANKTHSERGIASDDEEEEEDDKEEDDDVIDRLQ
ncbi:hypothetical protein Dimus_038816 [Dionaea muscipula]